MNGLLWSAPALAPLLVLAGLAFAGTRAAALRLAPWSALPGLAVALTAPAGVVDLPWLLLGGRIGLDHTGRVLLGAAALVWLCAGFHAARERRDGSAARYFAFYLPTMSGNLGLAVALDASTFQLGYALMGFAAYGLVVHRRSPGAFRAGRLYLALVVAGEMMIFAGASLLYREAGSTFFSDLTASTVASPVAGAAVALLLAGFAIKSAVVPLHVWLPPAYAAAPPQGTAVLGGAMINAGLLGWLRFLPLGIAAAPALGTICLGAGLVSAVYGPLMGVFQRDARAALGYSSVSQMGVIATVVGAVLVQPEVWPVASPVLLLYAVHHGLSKGALFLGVSVAPSARAPVARAIAAAGVLIPALVLAGVPATSGATAKDAAKTVAGTLPEPWTGLVATILPFVAVGTTLVIARALLLLRRAVSAEPQPRSAWASWLVLVAAAGTARWWLPGVVGWTAQPGAYAGIWGALWPVGLGVLAAAAALGARRAGLLRTWPTIPAGDFWRLLERAADSAARRVRTATGRGVPA